MRCKRLGLRDRLELAGQFAGADAARFEFSRRTHADLSYFGATRRH